MNIREQISQQEERYENLILYLMAARKKMSFLQRILDFPLYLFPPKTREDAIHMLKHAGDSPSWYNDEYWNIKANINILKSKLGE